MDMIETVESMGKGLKGKKGLMVAAAAVVAGAGALAYVMKDKGGVVEYVATRTQDGAPAAASTGNASDQNLMDLREAIGEQNKLQSDLQRQSAEMVGRLGDALFASQQASQQASMQAIGQIGQQMTSAMAQQMGQLQAGYNSQLQGLMGSLSGMLQNSLSGYLANSLPINYTHTATVSQGYQDVAIPKNAYNTNTDLGKKVASDPVYSQSTEFAKMVEYGGSYIKATDTYIPPTPAPTAEQQAARSYFVDAGYGGVENYISSQQSRLQDAQKSGNTDLVNRLNADISRVKQETGVK